MGRSNKNAWLDGPGDLREAEVEDVPTPGESVLVRGLPAAYSRDVISDCFEQRQIGETTINQVNTRKLAERQFAHGCVEPEFTLEEAEKVAERFGPAFEKVIKKVEELSGIDKETIESTEARFSGGGTEPSREGEAGTNGTPPGSGRSTVPVRTGA